MRQLRRTEKIDVRPWDCGMQRKQRKEGRSKNRFTSHGLLIHCRAKLETYFSSLLDVDDVRAASCKLFKLIVDISQTASRAPLSCLRWRSLRLVINSNSSWEALNSDSSRSVSNQLQLQVIYIGTHVYYCIRLIQIYTHSLTVYTNDFQTFYVHTEWLTFFIARSFNN